MRIAVIGGTGFVGGYLVDALLDASHAVSLMVRRGSEEKVQADASRKISGDVSDKSAVEATVEGCDAVIYCVGILRESPARGVTFESLQFDGVVRAVDAAKKNGVRRFLLMSANGAKVPGTPYQETKKRAEDYLLASGLDATVFRPSVIFGDPKGKMEIATQLYRDVVRPPVPAPGFRTSAGHVQMSPVHVADVADAFVKALADDSTFGKTYELGGPEILSWSDMITRVAKAVGTDKWILPVPVGLMKFGATLFDWLPFFPVTRDQLTMLAEGNTVDPSIVESLIGRPPQAFTPESLSYLAR
jgi:NADH dehydrogenase